MKKTLLLLLCIMTVMLVYGCAGGEHDVSSAAEGNTSVVVSETISSQSDAESTEIQLPPESSEEESLPDASSQEPSAPESSVEEPSKDEGSRSEESEPEESEPAESQPEESQPAESEPEESQPEDSQAEESQPEESEDEPVYDIGDAEWIESGYLLYNGAAYSQTRYNAQAAQQYADVYARYAELYPDLGIHVISHPSSVYNITNPAVAAMVVDQGEVLDQMQSHIYGGVNFVNLKTIFKEHAGEYLYFKSDFHWTQLGAYYAYCAFAESIGVTPTPLSQFEEVVTTDTFIGLTNTYANDPRINSFYDTIHVYFPRKEHTMAVHLSDMSLYRVYDNCIQTSIKTYSCYLTGDQAFSIINVPENDQSKTILVIKESSANAFVPFLTEHYGNIIVIDPRHIMLDVRKVIEEYGVKDILFFATASTCSRDAYCNYYRRLIGE